MSIYDVSRITTGISGVYKVTAVFVLLILLTQFDHMLLFRKFSIYPNLVGSPVVTVTRIMSYVISHTM